MLDKKYSCIREMLEDEERRTLSPYACCAADSRGREREEAKCDIRTDFQRDRDRILHSKSFRRLKQKTQVFLDPEGDHYRTRLTHTLEVSQIGRTISKALRLNQDLTEAIAMGHDLGHTPFGHSGEAVLNKVCKGGFIHSDQSVRVIEVLEKNGNGLNLTWEVRDGIKNHQTEGNPATLEGKVVRISDKIAYLNHDVDDAIRAGLLVEEDLPITLRKTLGMNCHDRLNSLIHDIIINPIDRDDVILTDEYMQAMQELRKWMFKHIYSGESEAKNQEKKAQQMIKLLFDYYMSNPEKMTAEYLNSIGKGTPKETAVCDYISGMTDNYAIEKFEELFVPVGWRY
ncbi:MAG: deoxyguanosinetriphosphate triphosphohydrolase [Eubacteriales bacterium]|nr:deoxyguanosinetriphosphate triphosphohydrolase [Eubacteriales bacterium]